jgi:hypothetical protein
MAEIIGPCPEIEIIRGTAVLYHRELADKKRRQRPLSCEQGSAAVEFVYHSYQSEEDWK